MQENNILVLPELKYAIIDLGSNTFHLLIIENVNSRIVTLFRERAYTFLSEGGLGYIKPERIAGIIPVLNSFKEELIKYNVANLRIIGTAALRKAKNAHLVTDIIENIFDQKVEIIDGSTEADYIFQGIMCFDEFHVGRHLIMDIGGGSTELIIVENGKKIWAESFTLGVGFLYSLNPIDARLSDIDINVLKNYIKSSASSLLNTIQNTRFDSLIGASGSFEVLLSILDLDFNDGHIHDISLSSFEKCYEKLIETTLNERLSMNNIPNERAKLIVIAMILKKVILDSATYDKITYCPYSIKEGVMQEMIHQTGIQKS